jgi:hypothetical protein
MKQGETRAQHIPVHPSRIYEYSMPLDFRQPSLDRYLSIRMTGSSSFGISSRKMNCTTRICLTTTVNRVSLSRTAVLTSPSAALPASSPTSASTSPTTLTRRRWSGPFSPRTTSLGSSPPTPIRARLSLTAVAVSSPAVLQDRVLRRHVCDAYLLGSLSCSLDCSSQ